MECLKLVSTQTRVLSLEPVKHGSKPDRHWCEASEEQRARPPSLSRSPSFLAHTRQNTQLESRLARSLDSGTVATRRRQWRCRVQPCLPPSLASSLPFLLFHCFALAGLVFKAHWCVAAAATAAATAAGPTRSMVYKRRIPC